jgi:hypothetical protein
VFHRACYLFQVHFSHYGRKYCFVCPEIIVVLIRPKPYFYITLRSIYIEVFYNLCVGVASWIEDRCNTVSVPIQTSTKQRTVCCKTIRFHDNSVREFCVFVPSVQQKSSGLKFSKSRIGSHVTYSYHHNSSCFSFFIYVHSWRFSVFHSLQTITPRIC